MCVSALPPHPRLLAINIKENDLVLFMKDGSSLMWCGREEEVASCGPDRRLDWRQPAILFIRVSVADGEGKMEEGRGRR